MTLTLERKGDKWRVDGHRCPDCHVEIPLVSDEKPGELAMKMAPLIICDVCDERMELVQHQLAQEHERVTRLSDSGLPAALQGFRWSEFDITEKPRKSAAASAYHWARHGGSVLLYGPLGTGKTRLAATAAWERLEHGNVRWCSVSSLITKASASFGSRERAEAVQVLAGTGPLVLDDLDKVPPTPYVRTQLFGAIDSRIAAGAPVLATTNLDAGELGGTLGDAIMSRVASFKQIYLGGRDRRQEQI